MQFDPALIEARLVHRYKRFLSEMELADGTLVTAHCPNPGSMMGLADPGSRCWLTHHTGGTRKLAYGWELGPIDIQDSGQREYVIHGIPDSRIWSCRNGWTV